MVRGRKRDMTVPVSRTAALQRDYRERKTKYIADLEERCRLLEEQNAKLIEEVQALRKMPNHRNLNATLEAEKNAAFQVAIKSLSAAMASMQHFQSLTTETNGSAIHNPSSVPSHGLSCTPTSSSLPQSTNTLSHQSPLKVDSHSPTDSNEMSSTPVSGGFDDSQSMLQQATDSENPFSKPEFWDPSSSSCCMGFFRCEAIESDKPPLQHPSSHVRTELPFPSRESSAQQTQSTSKSFER